VNGRRRGAADVISAGVTTGAGPVEPGLVQVHRWRPDPDDFAPEGVGCAHGAVGRKPGPVGRKPGE
jgi:hypothetical protein